MEDLFDVFEGTVEESKSDPNSEFHSQYLTYSEELWDSLDSIGINTKK